MGQDFISSLRAGVSELIRSLAHLLPRVLSALVILVLGWLLATLLRALTRRLALWTRVDRLVERTGDAESLKRAGLGPPHVILATAVYWITWVAVLLGAMTALDVAGTEALVPQFVAFLPSLAVAVAMLVLGFALANFAWRLALLAAVNARLHAANLLASLVRGLILIASVAMAVEQLGIGRGVVHTAFAVLFGALMLALAIAFGFGGRHAARRYLEERLLARDESQEDDEPSHL